MAETVTVAAENVAKVAQTEAEIKFKGMAAEIDNGIKEGVLSGKTILVGTTVQLKGYVKSDLHKVYIKLGSLSARIGGWFNTKAHNLIAKALVVESTETK